MTLLIAWLHLQPYYDGEGWTDLLTGSLTDRLLRVDSYIQSASGNFSPLVRLRWAGARDLDQHSPNQRRGSRPFGPLRLAPSPPHHPRPSTSATPMQYAQPMPSRCLRLSPSEAIFYAMLLSLESTCLIVHNLACGQGELERHLGSFSSRLRQALGFTIQIELHAMPARLSSTCRSILG